jgi:hypothetical protein
MDAAKAAMGQDGPSLRTSGTVILGANPERSAGPYDGASGFGPFFQEKRGSPVKGETALKTATADQLPP